MTVAAAAGLAGCGDAGDGGGQEGTPTEEETEPGQDSPTEEQTEEEGDGTQADLQVRAVHGVVGGPEVDVYLDDEPAFEGVAYKDVSDYESIDTQSTQVRVTAAGDEEQVLVEDELDIAEEGTYSVVAYGDAGEQTDGSDGEATATEENGTDAGESTPDDEEDMQQNDSQDGTPEESPEGTATPDGEPSQGDLQLAVLEDDTADAEGEEAQVRVFHGSPDAPDIDVATPDEEEPLVSGLGYGETSEYATVPSGTQTLEVRPAGESDAVAEFEAELEAGRGHTGYAVGYLEAEDPSDEEAFDLIGVVDGTGDDEMATDDESTGNDSSAENDSSMENDSSAENDSSTGEENETSTP